MFSMLSKTVSSGIMKIETGDQRYSQTISESRVRNIRNGHAMLPDSTVLVNAVHFHVCG